MNIRGVAGAGSSDDGEYMAVIVTDEAGAEHELLLHYSKMSGFVGAVLVAWQSAAKRRPALTPGGAQMPVLSSLLEVQAIQAQQLPDSKAALRLVAEGAPLDFVLSHEQVAAMQSLLSRLESGPSGKSPTASH